MVAAALMLAVLLGAGRATQAQTTPQTDAAALDRLIHAAWRQQGIVPAKTVDDARYLRRIYLDITGSIPPEEAVSEFLWDHSPNKRAKAVEALLDSPAYADHWTYYWDNVLMGKPAPMATVDYAAFRRWLHGEFAQNTPYNRFATDLITASGLNSTGPTYAEALGFTMTAPTTAVDPDRPKIDPASVNGAVNWHLRFAANPADVAGIASKIFLGVQIQCAQCHDHKTEKWKQADFRSFTACFIQTVGIPTQRYTAGQAMKGIIPYNVRDVNFIVRGNKMNGGEERAPYVEATPVTLDGTPITAGRMDRRKELAAWMTSNRNPWFAQALVNRMWARFLGRGFIEPIDDFRPSNPGVLPDALQLLAKDFTAHNYDLKTLIKTICATEAYQLSSVPGGKADPQNTLWDHYRLKPMEVNEIVNSLITATNFQPILVRVSGGNLEQYTVRLQRLLTFTFNTDEPESEQKDFEGTIPQALLMLNNGLTNSTVTPIPGSALADVLAMPGSEADRITSLYLRTLSRRPSAAEIDRWTAFLTAPREVVLAKPGDLPPAAPRPNPAMAGKPGQQGMGMGMGRAGNDPLARMAVMRNRVSPPTPRQQAYEDMFWALLNSSEFVFNH
jgi:hypothetical protein